MQRKNCRAMVPAMAGLLLAIGGVAIAQDLPPGIDDMPTREELAKDNNLFLTFARKALKWDIAAEPVKIVGPLYFVGTEGLSSWLFATSEGLILLNTAMPEAADLVEQSIQTLGYDPKDIKIIVNGHAHSDHAGAIAHFKELSGAQLAIMEADVPPMEDGGKSDFHYGADWQVMGFPPAEVDRVLRDGDTVRLGEVILTAYSTPGHTRGSTTWVTQLVEEGKAYTVVFPDGGGFNPGYRVAGDSPSYPGITEDYRRTHHVWEMLKPDIWLGHHTEYFDLAGKRERARTEGINAWVDPEGYRRFVAGKKQAFEDEVDIELGAPDGAAR
jgi:metallo-beta-lactamase class B